MSTFKGEITDLSFKGFGVTKDPDGMSVFVQGGWPGDVGRFRITERKKRYSFAVIEELFTPSPTRVEADCKYHGYNEMSCGGCPWMMIDYPEQIRAKEQIVESQLSRHNLMNDDLDLRAMITSKSLTGYRNRVKVRTDGKDLGFYSHGSKTFVPVDDCIVLNQSLRNKLKELKPTLSKFKSSLEKVDTVALEIDDSTPIEAVNPKRSNSFRQANPGQNERMKTWLQGCFSGDGQSKKDVLELFSGSGNLTKVLVEKKFQKILCFDDDKRAISNLNRSFAGKAQGYVANLFSSLKGVEDYSEALNSNILLVDPPRAGYALLSMLVSKMPNLEKIIYISCDISTFCRDVSKIQQGGWKIRVVQPIDMFPQTPHIEVMAVIER